MKEIRSEKFAQCLELGLGDPLTEEEDRVEAVSKAGVHAHAVTHRPAHLVVHDVRGHRGEVRPVGHEFGGLFEGLDPGDDLAEGGQHPFVGRLLEQTDRGLRPGVDVDAAGGES